MSIDSEDWSTLDVDVKGEVYEGLLAKNADDVRGGAGQYFTPRPVIRAIVDVMRPVYINHLNSPTGDGATLDRWVEKKSDLLCELLYQMAQRLKYDIDKVTIQKNVYYPKGFWDIESEQHALRKAALKVFSGEQAIQAMVVGAVQTMEPLPLPEEINPPQLVRQPSLGPPKPAVSDLPTIQAEVVPQPEKRR